MELGLGSKVVLVTGGTDGLGLALAERLVAEGAHVAVCGRDAGRLADTERRLGGEALVLRADVTVPADVDRFVAGAAERWGRIDGVVNNAGRSAAAGLADLADEDWTADLDLKVLGAVRVTRAALPHLQEAGGGSVVNVLAIGAKAPGAGSLPTSASRAAGLALTKSLSIELGPAGVRVNAILVGLVESGQWRRRAEAAGLPLDTFLERLAADAKVPAGRVGRAEEFADLASYLLSERSSYVSGSAVNLDGGLSPVL